MESQPPRSGDLTAALDALPLFPLPSAVLLPGALMPLHIFEPRYRRMIRDALDGHRALAIVCITGSEVDQHGHPPIASVAGAGTIVDYAELPSGRYNIVVKGRARVSLEELPFETPYRRARATVLSSVEDSVAATDIAGLVASANSFVALVRGREPSFEFRMPSSSEPGVLADHCAQHLLVDARDRQKTLEMLKVSERVQHVTEVLAMQRMTLVGPSGPVN